MHVNETFYIQVLFPFSKACWKWLNMSLKVCRYLFNVFLYLCLCRERELQMNVAITGVNDPEKQVSWKPSTTLSVSQYVKTSFAKTDKRHLFLHKTKHNVYLKEPHIFNKVVLEKYLYSVLSTWANPPSISLTVLIAVNSEKHVFEKL